MIIEEQGHADRIRETIKGRDRASFNAAIEAIRADIRRGIIECIKCNQRNRLKLDTPEQVERAIEYAVCGSCKARLLCRPRGCFCGMCAS